ncbi:hypothetical protein PMAYCL1PPCAC_07313 [Pristionchus mayeri]|uniref:Uncharacterized protein n=1 Tax=Pristionchus mayeri TaxID=1317129 RepID=A0AAN4ZBV6_9BILA|nr:hypothetical protein PMAYCL1PPCAC_07313 [Pristionchus mayeri]
MGLLLPLIPLLLVSSSLANPIPLDKAVSFSPDDIGILEQSAPKTTPLEPSDRMTCDNSGADRCLLFPIGCIPSESCTDRLEMRRVQSGSNIGDIIVSLNLHVSRSDHMLVAVPMPDLSNPNSTFLIGCSIEDAVAVVATPDVDGVTEQLQMPWLRLVAVRASSSELECIVSASPGHVDLPEGDVAVFAGELEPEEEVRQSARIAGSLEEERREEDERKSEERREEEERIPSHEHSEVFITPSISDL